MVSIILAIRFILEIITVLGLFVGIFIQKNIFHKIIYFILSVAITLIWSRYGAPKSPHVLVGVNKFILEVIVYAVGSVGFYKLFGSKVGTIYLVIVVIDLVLMYVLGLQGN